MRKLHHMRTISGWKVCILIVTSILICKTTSATKHGILVLWNHIKHGPIVSTNKADHVINLMTMTRSKKKSGYLINPVHSSGHPNMM
mmetsp:Transcript_37158/g.90113  ORF Transcript_37158/g.90113 Transcript_37158/m.90113 type:complete len:87 (+) Transcript_37158:1027-1287(+)